MQEPTCATLRARFPPSPGVRASILIIVIAQLFGTSLWFSANSAADDLIRAWGLDTPAIGTLTIATQSGFIIGTLSFAVTALADRFRASRIFAVCALLGAVTNASFALFATSLASGLPLRFLVGFSLAGVYPLGMKLVVSWVPDRAGNALAQLVGMLTLGTALPHGLRFLGTGLPWQAPILLSSVLAMLAAAMIFQLGDGPYLQRAPNASPARLGTALRAFQSPTFRASAFGYFGHMWELYAFWTLVPVLAALAGIQPSGSAALAGFVFLVIGIGAISCMLGGWWSEHIGSARVAATFLAVSALCCALYPFTVNAPLWVSVAVMLLWGASAPADSPQFSALSARACPPEILGSALAAQNGIGFALTLIAIHFGTLWVGAWGARIAWLLLPGPLLGLLGLYPLWRRAEPRAR